MNKARKAFYSDFIDSNSEDQGKLFRSMKKLQAPSQCLLFLGEFFCRQIYNIRTELDSYVLNQEEKKKIQWSVMRKS